MNNEQLSSKSSANTKGGCVEEEGGRAGRTELEKREGWHREGGSSLWGWPGGGRECGKAQRRGKVREIHPSNPFVRGSVFSSPPA